MGQQRQTNVAFLWHSHRWYFSGKSLYYNPFNIYLFIYFNLITICQRISQKGERIVRFSSFIVAIIETSSDGFFWEGATCIMAPLGCTHSEWSPLHNQLTATRTFISAFGKQQFGEKIMCNYNNIFIYYIQHSNNITPLTFTH